ncbi:UDP-glucose dehydrogenase family protein [Sedimentisphaera salicampi]|uniref:UDP-glucose 6-dehydrogenase n=1 Tax=Sedimentisphaera salicampi TaxID=1941349 RepID=A0A1W6LLX7_9BACT|nr:UDP-glucose/GDP-mannose dehydrogenase family protein [Sedimentisphaera salicampi]ARN56753.1 UDP-glucose 6-dehydrogenase TuaD [Sedimentisphaera salicampi]
MKISVVGVGYVGLVAAACLAEGGNNVICVDKDGNKIEGLKKGIIPIYEPGLEELVERNSEAGRLEFTTDIAYGVQNSGVTFIGVGTPSSPDGSADISAVKAVSEAIAKYMTGRHVIVTKSTVPVGTHKVVSDIIKENTNHPFDYVSNPEFLKEGSAVQDFLKPDRVIIGTTKTEIFELMTNIYAPFMRKSSRMIFVDPASAEMAKYAANAMLATRITFMNELSGLCEQFGADIEKVRIGIGSDSRIGKEFLFAGLGYGGSCFPKDVKALAYMGDEQGIEMTIAKSVQAANYRQQDRFAERIIKYCRENGLSQISAWGLAFKAKTDDIRESPAIRSLKKITEAGLKVKAFDPEAMENAARELGEAVEMCEDVYQTLEGSDVMAVLTDWQEFRSPDFDTIREKLSRPVIFDGRNLYSPDFVAGCGIEYHSIGR